MTGDRGGRRLLPYALANIGAVVAYLPLLTLLLPIKVQAIAGPERLGVLTASTLAGAVAASGANIVFGMLSDRAVARGGGRRRGIVAGWTALAASYLLLHLAAGPAGIVAAVVVFQVAVNALLAPVMAAMADEIPDAHKTLAGGLLVLASPAASLVSLVLVGGALPGEGAQFAVVCAAVALFLAPLLATVAAPVDRSAPATAIHATSRSDLVLAGAARLLVQVAGNVLFVYLLYYFGSVARGSAATLAADVGRVQALAYALPVPVAIVVGRLADRHDRRGLALVCTAGLAAAGLVLMAVARDWSGAATGFALYACGSAAFLGLQQGVAMRMLPSPRHRGRDLGLLNLTNTLPALVGPALTWWLATADDFTGLLLFLAALTVAGGLLMLPLDRRQAGKQRS